MRQDNTTIKNLKIILAENEAVLSHMEGRSVALLEDRIKSVKRIFFAGAGRTGLALKMAAMRFMHLGYNVHIMGETTTPAILEGDMLIVGSGSGTTTTLVSAVEKAKRQKATVVAITTAKDSPIARISDHILIIKAAVKTDFGESASEQYAGSLFEQSVLIMLDAVFMKLWKDSGLTKEDLWTKHANLE
ncbi:6-phospho-3-hexuloisomerase [Sinomicrobium oceani]|uniref:6-phospho-3-hexuloisomerase n=1 Tax=Sinomicrobium oceani TaxID=1150368 RepID=A0A1K1PF68_9FLAO|nr:6-phospho-3-hexuloisomerase [Sinomicrobium oceani]SFW46434.1 6-phospho-3-hexuloisomerase [Sinomicrobium oceani]